jgi:hypothetical protein
METLMNTEIEDIENMRGRGYGNNNDHIRAHVDGFKHGTAQAIEMYLQVAEEQLIRRAG